MTAYNMRIVDWSSDVCSSDLHQAVEYAIARKRDDVARIEGEHPLVTLEAGTGAQPHVERERDLRDAATFSPARCQTVDALGVAAMDEHHVRDAVADLVEGGQAIVAEGQRIVFGSMTGRTRVG